MDPAAGVDEPEDVFETYVTAAIEDLRGNRHMIGRLREFGHPWYGVQVALEEALPDVVDDRGQLAYSIVPRAMNEIFGEQKVGWDTEKRKKK